MIKAHGMKAMTAITIQSLTSAAFLIINNDGRFSINREIKINVAAANGAFRHKDN